MRKGLVYGNQQYGLTDYTFDSLGNILSLSENGIVSELQKDVSYSYDNLSRLTSANYGNSEAYSYSYDDLGNIITSSKLWNYIYSDNGTNNPHAVTSIWTMSYSYDNNGNLTAYTGTGWVIKSFTYNTKDELLSSQDDSWNITDYHYDNKGIRIEKSSSGSLNRYLGKDYEILTETTAAGTTTKISKYIFLWSKKIASIEDDTVIYHDEDHLWGWNIDLSSSWTLLQVVDYFPFGEIRSRVNYEDYENKYLFGWKEQDSETDLQYFEARYYDNALARFNSIDRVFWEVWDSERAQIGLMNPQRFNSYSYTWNNPLARSDSTWEWWDVAVDSLVAAGWIWYGKVTWDEFLVIGAQNMLKDTLKPQNAINPLKKIKKLEKWVDAGNKIIKKISIQKQNKHIKWTKEYEQELKNREWTGKSLSTWENPWEADKLTQEAFEKWIPYKWQTNKKIYDFWTQVGNKKWETKVQVHESKSSIHWNPHK